MKPRPFLIFFAMAFVAFVVYFFRSGIIYADGYGYLSMACNIGNPIIDGGVFNYLVYLIPCNILIVKMLLFCLVCVSGYFIIKWCTIFSERNGWRASYLLFLTPFFLLEASKFENDQFAFPLMFAALYFWFSEKKIRAIALTALAFSLWQGAAIYAIGFAAVSFWPVVPTITAIFFLWPGLSGLFLRHNFAQEDVFLLPTIRGWLFLLAGIPALALKAPKVFPMALICIAVGIASLKFAILAVPFLVLGFVLLLDDLEKSESPFAKRFFKLHWLVAVFMLVITIGIIWTTIPSDSEWQALSYAEELSDGNYTSDWGMLYWRQWLGEKVDCAGSVHCQEDRNGTFSVSWSDLDCNLLKDFERIKVFKC